MASDTLFLFISYFFKTSDGSRQHALDCVEKVRDNLQRSEQKQ